LMIKKYICLLLLIPCMLWGANYYVKNGGNDGADGLSDGNAWETVNKVNISSFSPGDTIFFNKGDTWREQLTVPSSGSSGSPIVFTSYGSGADPIIKGSNLVATWTGGNTSEALGSKSNDASGSNDFNFRCRVIANELSQDGNMVRVRILGHVSGSPIVSSYIGEQAAAGDLYDMEPGTITQITWNGGDSSYTIPASQDTWSDWILYDFDKTKNYWISIGSTAGYTRQDFTGTGRDYHKASSSGDADVANVTGYTVLNDHWYHMSDFEVKHVWEASLTTEPNQVFFDGARGNNQSSIGDVDSEYNWHWVGNKLYCYASADPDGLYTSPGVEAEQRDFCITASTKNYITIDGITCRHAVHGINGDGTNWTVQNDTLQDNYYFGLRANGTVSACDDWTIQSNIVSGNGATGIHIATDADACSIKKNTVYNNCQLAETSDHNYSGGIRLSTTNDLTNNVIEQNKVYSNGYGGMAGSLGTQRGGGIWIDTAGSGNIIRYNQVYSNYYLGIKLDFDSLGTQVYGNLAYTHTESDAAAYGAGISVDGGADGCKIYNNTCYGNRTGIGLSGQFPEVAGDMENIIVKNNICFDNTVDEMRMSFGAENDGTYGSGNVYLNNCLGVESSNFIQWGNVVYKSTYDDWESAYGSSTSSVEADPLMTNPASDDFTLQSNSPCINTGTNVGLTLDYDGNEVPRGAGYDIGAYEYQLVQSGSWYLGSGWSVSGNKVVCNGNQIANSDIYQNINANNGSIYRIRFVLSDFSAGTITPMIGTSSVRSFSSNGTHTIFIKANGNTLYMRANSDFVGKLDNISVRKVL
jgi:parallel beta-helix repeat protein